MKYCEGPIIFSMKTFEQIINKEMFCIGDIEENWQNIKEQLKIFNSLPRNIQGIAIRHGITDTEFRDRAYTYLLEGE